MLPVAGSRRRGMFKCRKEAAAGHRTATMQKESIRLRSRRQGHMRHGGSQAKSKIVTYHDPEDSLKIDSKVV